MIIKSSMKKSQAFNSAILNDLILCWFTLSHAANKSNLVAMSNIMSMGFLTSAMGFITSAMGSRMSSVQLTGRDQTVTQLNEELAPRFSVSKNVLE